MSALAIAEGHKPMDIQMNGPLLLLLRERVASRFYERPEVVDALARAILRPTLIAPS